MGRPYHTVGVHVKQYTRAFTYANHQFAGWFAYWPMLVSGKADVPAIEGCARISSTCAAAPSFTIYISWLVLSNFQLSFRRLHDFSTEALALLVSWCYCSLDFSSAYDLFLKKSCRDLDIRNSNGLYILMTHCYLWIASHEYSKNGNPARSRSKK